MLKTIIIREACKNIKCMTATIGIFKIVIATIIKLQLPLFMTAIFDNLIISIVVVHDSNICHLLILRGSIALF